MEIISKSQESTTKKYNWKKDKSFFSLLISNILSIVLMVMNGSSIFTMGMVYLVQLIITGFFTYIRIIKMRGYDAGGLEVNGKKVSNSGEMNWQVANTFLLMYLFVMLFFFLFIMIGYFAIDLWVVLIAGIVYFFNHLYSFKQNYKGLTTGGDMSSVVFNQFIRAFSLILILPAIMLSSFSIIPVLIIRAYADQMVHMAKHGKVFSRSYFDTIAKIAVIIFFLPFLLPVLFVIFVYAVSYFLEMISIFWK